MHVLVTGCAGFIGSVLVRRLLEHGHSVVGVDSLRHGNGASVLPLINESGFCFYRADVRQGGFLDHLIAEADAVIPLAALVGAPLCEKNEAEAYDVNFYAIRRLVRNLSPKQRLIYPNTNSGYGETDGTKAVTEDDPMNPISVYGVTKCMGEQEVLSHPNAVSLRLATVFGTSPRMRFDLLVNDFTRRIWTGWARHTIPSFGFGPRTPLLTIYEPHFKRNFVHILDVADAFCHFLSLEGRNQIGAFNLGNPEANLTKLELAHRVCKTLGVAENVVAVGEGTDPDRRNYLVSNDKVLATGFEFGYALEDGIKEVAVAADLLTPEQQKAMANA